MLQTGRKTHAQGNGSHGRSAPQGMPREVAAGSRAPKQIEQKRDILPEQKPVTDEVEVSKAPSKARILLKRVAIVLSVGLALALAYLFLLLGEPDATIEPKTTVKEESIRVPMAALEVQGGADLNTVAATFGKPVLILYGDFLPLQKVTLYDTAFQGGYARRATFLYTFPDGQILKAETLRPIAAAALLGTAGSLRIERIYGLAGLNATRMDNADSICILAQSEEAVFALTCPTAHEGDLAALLKQTTILDPAVSAP